MPLYRIANAAPRRRRKKPVMLAIFRGVPALRRYVERQLKAAMGRMHEDAAQVARDANLGPRGQAEALEAVLLKWEAKFKALGDDLAKRLVNGTADAGKAHWMSQAEKTMGIPVNLIYKDEAMKRTLETAAVGAATYIKSIPADHIGRVAVAMVLAMKQQPQPEGRTLIQQIQEIGQVSQRRAEFIARDQWHKINGTIDEAQQRDIGVGKYIWRTAKDIRVVGAPGGPYKPSKLHGNHAAREGKIFSWDNPPADGHPGQPIGCRCFAQAVIDESLIQE